MAYERLTNQKMDIGTGVVLIVLAGVVIYEGVRLGWGWGTIGPEPGFFPFWLAVGMVLGVLGAIVTAVKQKDTRPFFEATEEVKGLVQVGIPIVLTLMVITWLGLYLSVALYVWLFTWWYGRFRWWSSIISGVAVSSALYALLFKGFRLNMPMSIWYGTDLPVFGPETIFPL